jgi:hypothetical protein
MVVPRPETGLTFSGHCLTTEIKMSHVNSPTRRYVASTLNIPECCKTNEHSSIKEAFECIILKENDPLTINIKAIDWAFGLRAIVPTFGSEWQEINKYRTIYRLDFFRPLPITLTFYG